MGTTLSAARDQRDKQPAATGGIVFVCASTFGFTDRRVLIRGGASGGPGE